MNQIRSLTTYLKSMAADKSVHATLPFHAILLLSVCCSIAVAQPAPPPDQRSTGTAELQSNHEVIVPAASPGYVALFTEYDRNFNNGRGVSDADNTNGQLAWLQSYQMLAYMQMYRATSETKWLDKVAVQFDRALECRDDKLGRVDVHAKKPLKGWGTATYDKAGWHVFVVHTGMVCQGPAEFVRMVKENPALQSDYGTTATRFLSEIETIAAEANQQLKTNAAGEGWYEDPGIGGNGGIVPLNMSNAMGSVLVELYRVTGKPDYRDKATALATYFKNCLRDNGNGGYNWSYWPKTSDEKVVSGEDISHASLNVDFASRCASAGIVFTAEDIEKFARTWLRTVDKGNGKWAIRVDGSDGSIAPYIPQAPGRWMSIIVHLDVETARKFYGSVANAFAGENINRPSRALGVANLARFQPKP